MVSLSLSENCITESALLKASTNHIFAFVNKSDDETPEISTTSSYAKDSANVPPIETQEKRVTINAPKIAKNHFIKTPLNQDLLTNNLVYFL
jgi:hypothetical protein